MCSHVSAAVLARATLPPRSTVVIDVVADITLEMIFCNVCVAERGLTTLPQRASGDDWDESSDKFKTTPVCARCLAALDVISQDVVPS